MFDSFGHCCKLKLLSHAMSLGVIKRSPSSDSFNLLFIETSAPQNVQHVLKGDDGVQITWETPASYCHLIINYKVTVIFVRTWW